VAAQHEAGPSFLITKGAIMIIASRLAVLSLALLTITGWASMAQTVIPVPNGEFSDADNTGSIGGGLLNGDAGPIDIGIGPWQGSYQGVLGILAPPSLTITTTGGFTGSGSATISGLVGVDVLGIGLLDNGGSFSEATGTAFVSGTTYQLAADLSVGSVLSLNVLSNAGVGIGLTDSSGVVAATNSSPTSLVSLSLLSSNTYQLTLDYTATAAATGNMGISLFDQPSGLLTANLFESTTFSDVQLAVVPLPEPAAITLLGVGLIGVFGFMSGRNFRRIRSLFC
jgi:hypothetical protein